MADLDAELLALAGGDESSGDEASSPPRGQSPSPEPPRHRKSPTPPAMGQKGTARPVKSTARRRAARKRDSDDEGSDASSRRDSIDSAPMSQSESEGRSPPPSDDGPIFPYDKYYHSAQDKADIMAMPEIQREEIIAERAQQVERHQQDMALRRLLATREREEARAAEKKRKASAADLEETQRKSSRQRTTIGGRRAGEASSAIEAYKRHREEKSQRDAQRRQEAAARAKAKAERGESPHDDFDDGEAEESEVEWDDPKPRRRTPTPPKDDPVAELADIQRARIGRDNFAQVCFYPGFDGAVQNCYTRICIGPGPNGQIAYRLTKIVGFTKGRPYAIRGPNGRMFVTDQWALAAHGKAERAWPFLECSNSPFTEDEWRRYRVVLANENIKLPTKGQVNKKLDEINKLINHHFTEAEITEKMRRQNGLMDMVMRVPERKDIEERRRLARAVGDQEAIRQCEDELKALVPMKLACNSSLSSNRSEPTTSEAKKNEADRLAEINRRNQQINAENVRKAQLAESRVKRTRAPAPPQQSSDASAKIGDGLLKPPSAAAKALDDELFGSDRSRAGTPLTGTNTPKKPSTPAPSTPDLVASIPVVRTANASGDKKKATSGFGLLRKRQKEEDVLANMDLGIEIEI